MVNNVHDPYFELLAIPPSEQPPTLYKLLGVPRFTENKSVIRNAASQRMQFLRRVGGEKFLNDVQRILNEVVEAKILLMDDERRIVYDDDLRLIEEQIIEQAQQLAAEQSEDISRVARQIAETVVVSKVDSAKRLQQKQDSISELPHSPKGASDGSDSYYRVQDYSDSRLDDDESLRSKGFYRDPSQRPLRRWDNVEGIDNSEAKELSLAAPLSPSFPTRTQAAEQKAAEVRDLLQKTAQKGKRRFTFTEPNLSPARRRAIAIFLDGSLAGTAVEFTQQKHFFRLRRNGVMLPVVGESSHKPNFAFQEVETGWECRATRQFTINNKIRSKTGKLKSGDVIRLSMNGPKLLWLDSEEHMSELTLVKPAELTARALLCSTALVTGNEESRIAERNEGKLRKKKERLDPNVLLKRLIYGAVGGLIVFVALRQWFYS